MKRFFAILLVAVIVLGMCVGSAAAMAEEKPAYMTTENMEIFAKLMNSEDPDSKFMKKFAEKYNGVPVEVNGYISDIIIEDIVIQAGTCGDEVTRGPVFVLKDVEPEDLGGEGFDFPDFVEYQSNVRVLGKIKDYVDDDWIINRKYIELELISMESRDVLPQEAEQESSGYKTLEKGSQGEEVMALQKKLIELGYLDGEADGSYGNHTKEAVEKFQSKNGLNETGIADASTQAAVFAAEKPKETLSFSSVTTKIGSLSITQWNVEGKTFTLKGKKTKTVKTKFGKYKFDARGNYEKVGD